MKQLILVLALIFLFGCWEVGPTPKGIIIHKYISNNEYRFILKDYISSTYWNIKDAQTNSNVYNVYNISVSKGAYESLALNDFYIEAN